MQEGVFLEADVHERGFQAVFEIAHLAFEDAADEALFGRALDVEFLQLAFFEHGDAGFQRLGVDDDFLVDFFDRLDHPLDFLDDLVGGGLDGFHDALGRLLGHGTGCKGFFLLHLRRACPDAARENRVFWPVSGGFSEARRALPAAGRRRCFRRARFPGVAPLGQRPFPLPPFSPVTSARASWRRGRFFAGVLAQAAAGAEAHAAAAAPGKISFTHKLIGPFDRYRRFAKCPWRSTSRALKTRRNLAAAVACPSRA